MFAARPSRSPATRLLIAGLVAALIAAPGCRGNSSLPTAPQLPNQTGAALFSIEIQARARAVAVGQQLALRVQGKDDRDTPIDVTATWKSSDPTVARVDAQGNVTGLKKGNVTITATTKTPPREATIQLTVLGPGETAPSSGGGMGFGGDDLDSAGSFPGFDPAGDDPTSPPADDGAASPGAATTGGPPAPPGLDLSVYPAVPRVAPGERIRLVALQGPKGGEAPAAAVWRSADPAIATVDDAGVVTARKAGRVTITASSLVYPALTQQVELAVIAPAPVQAIRGIRISPSRVAMNVGETFWLLAEVPTNDGGYDPLIHWESGDPEVVVVSETGQVTAMGPGTTTITAVAAGYTAGDLSAVVPVEVRNVSIGRTSSW